MTRSLTHRIGRNNCTIERIKDKGGLPQLQFNFVDGSTRIFAFIEKPHKLSRGHWEARALEKNILWQFKWKCEEDALGDAILEPDSVDEWKLQAWIPLGIRRNPEENREALESYLEEKGVLCKGEAYFWDEVSYRLGEAVANDYVTALGLEGADASKGVYLTFIADEWNERDFYYKPEEYIGDELFEALDRVLAKKDRSWLAVNEDARPLNDVLARLHEAGDTETLRALKNNLIEDNLSISSKQILGNY